MKKGFLFLILCSQVFILKAEHILGGELSYKLDAVSNNMHGYYVTLKIFRDCTSFQQLENQVSIHIATNSFFYQKIELEKTSTQPIYLTNLPYCVINEPTGCVEVTIYTGYVNLEKNNEGYHLFYSNCCRDYNSTNIKTDFTTLSSEDRNGVIIPGQGFTYKAFIPPQLTTNINSSPVSTSDTSISICVDRPFNYQYKYSDPDGDSISFELCSSYGIMTNNSPQFTNVNYNSGYSGQSPISGSPAFTLSSSGLLTGTPNLQGFYTIVLCINEYRDNRLIATHRREEQISVFDCEIQPPPDIIECDSTLVLFTNRNNPLNVFLWDFGVPELINDTSQRIYPVYNYPRDGDFRLKLKVTNSSRGCSDSAYAEIRIARGLNADFTYNNPICNGQLIHLSDRSYTTSGFITGRQWRLINRNHLLDTLPDISFNYSVPNTQIYPFSFELTVQNSLGCSKTVMKVIEIYPNPIANAGPDTALAFNHPYTMKGSGGLDYKWSPPIGLSNSYIPNPVLVHNRDQEYILEVGSNTCIDRDTVFIKYYKGPDVYIPNAFTPNGDGRNDFFSIVPVQIKTKRFAIFNRWGSLIFQTLDGKSKWDGKVNGIPQPSGTYVWLYEGEYSSGEKIIKKGTLQLLQ